MPKTRWECYECLGRGVTYDQVETSLFRQIFLRAPLLEDSKVSKTCKTCGGSGELMLTAEQARAKEIEQSEYLNVRIKIRPIDKPIREPVLPPPPKPEMFCSHCRRKAIFVHRTHGHCRLNSICLDCVRKVLKNPDEAQCEGDFEVFCPKCNEKLRVP